VILISNEPVDLRYLDAQLDSAPDNKKIKPFPPATKCCRRC